MSVTDKNQKRKRYRMIYHDYTIGLILQFSSFYTIITKKYRQPSHDTF